MKKLELWHNPRCSKSRLTLALLEENGAEVEAFRYLDTPPDAERLTQVLSWLGMEPRELMRKTEKEYKELGLSNESLSREVLIQSMVKNPRLIERPIAILGEQAVIGRPPENVLVLIDKRLRATLVVTHHTTTSKIAR